MSSVYCVCSSGSVYHGYHTFINQIHGIIEPQTGLGWNASSKEDLLPTSLLWAGTYFTRPGCSELRAVWPKFLLHKGEKIGLSLVLVLKSVKLHVLILPSTNNDILDAPCLPAMPPHSPTWKEVNLCSLQYILEVWTEFVLKQIL